MIISLAGSVRCRVWWSRSVIASRTRQKIPFMINTSCNSSIIKIFYPPYNSLRRLWIDDNHYGYSLDGIYVVRGLTFVRYYVFSCWPRRSPWEYGLNLEQREISLPKAIRLSLFPAPRFAVRLWWLERGYNVVINRIYFSSHNSFFK